MPDHEDDGTLDTVDDLLWLIAEMPSAVSDVDSLLDDCALRRIGCDADAMDALVAQGRRDGLIDVWADQGNEWLTLSPLGAKLIDVEIGRGSDRWFPRGKAPTADVDYESGWTSALDVADVIELAGMYRSGDEARPNRRGIVDPAAYSDPTCPEPIDVLIDAEYLSNAGTLIGPSNRKLRDGSRVNVRMILGLNAPWPAAFDPLIEVSSGEPRRYCRGCGSDIDDPHARLPRTAVCVVCHKSGVDHQMPRVEPELLPGGRRAYRGSRLAGGQGQPARESA